MPKMKILYKYNRHIALYYGSMNFNACLVMIGSIIKGVVLSHQRNRNKLSTEICKSFKNQIGVYAFTSARGAIAAFLRVSGAENRDVFLSAYTCLAVPTAVLAAGAKPNYCDINMENLNLDLLKISHKINSNTHTIIAQHTLGNLLDIEKLRKIIHGKNIVILEDCALAAGSEKNGKIVGSDGDASIYSFELSKTITTGWGGLLVISNATLRKKMDTYYSSLNMEKTTTSLRKAWQVIVSGISYHPIFYNYLGKYILYFGYKYKFFMVSTPENEDKGIINENFITRLHGIQSNFAVYQWKNLNIIGTTSHENFNIISNHLKKLGFINFRPKDKYFYVSPRVSFLVDDPTKAMEFFCKYGIEMGRWFDGPLSPKPKTDLFNYNNKQYPVANSISKHIVNLPCHSRLSRNDMNHILLVINEFSKNYPKSNITLASTAVNFPH